MIYRKLITVGTCAALSACVPLLPSYDPEQIKGDYLVQIRIVDQVDPGNPNKRGLYFKQGLINVIVLPADDPVECLIHEFDHMINPAPSHSPDEDGNIYCL